MGFFAIIKSIYFAVKGFKYKGFASFVRSFIIYFKKIFITIIFTTYPFVFLVKIPYFIYKPKVIAVVGSVGKTTTKELIVSLLKTKGNVLYTKDNDNLINDLIKNLFKLKRKHDFLVVELGLEGPNWMDLFAKLISIDIVVFTNIAPAHFAYYDYSLKKIYLEKIKILKSLKPNGTIVFNKDDIFFRKLDRITGFKKKSFGTNDANIMIQSIKNKGLQGTQFVINYDEKKITLDSKLLGDHNVYNITAAFAVANIYGINNDIIKEKIKKKARIHARLQLTNMKHNIILIEDYENIHPASVQSAMNLMKKVKKRKLFVFGDMYHLKERGKEYHKDMAKRIREASPTIVFLIGNLVSYTAKELHRLSLPKENIFLYKSHDELLKGILNNLQPNDIILFKSNYRFRLDIITKKLKLTLGLDNN